MNNTKENILLTALRLFARDGYEAVSISQISGELGMAKSALYKHYANKKDLLDSIVERMNEMDYERAKKYEMPEGIMGELVEAYKETPIDKIKTYSRAQFEHWTEDEFAACFRKVLLLEKFRNEELAKLYDGYMLSGPIDYMTELFAGMTGNNEDAKQLAIEFYAPIYLMFDMYDGTENNEEIKKLLEQHIDRFAAQLGGR